MTARKENDLDELEGRQGVVLRRDALHPADVVARDIRVTPAGARFRLVTPSGQSDVRTQLRGRFNVLNWLAAAAAAHVFGIGPEAVARAAAALPPIAGRMEPIECGQPFAVIVDFAHTPQAPSVRHSIHHGKA